MKTIVKIGFEYNTLANTYLNQKNKALGKVHALPGLHIGKVKKIDKDPDGEFRVLVDVPVIKESGDGIWARIVSPYSSKSIGFYFYPEVGDEVILGFLGNDPRYAIIVGSVYSKKEPTTLYS